MKKCGFGRIYRRRPRALPCDPLDCTHQSFCFVSRTMPLHNGSIALESRNVDCVLASLCVDVTAHPGRYQIAVFGI